MAEKLHITACCRTDSGLVRSHNEDVCFVDAKNRCFMVADGMGGAAAGEVASGMMKETVLELFALEKTHSVSRLRDLVCRCFQTANARMLAHIAEEHSHSGMGCTAELLVFGDRDFVLGHVGDSRCYRLRKGNLEQLTRDHTLVQMQLDQGLIDREQAERHSMKNVILRAIGTKEELEVDIINGSILPGDIFLLCSDGLTGMVDDKKIQEIMSYDGPPPLKATLLVDQANHSGGKDNISVVLVEVTEVCEPI